MLLLITSLWPIILWKALPIHSDRPIALADATTNGLDLAYYFLGGTADTLRWAQCIGDATANYFAWAHKISGRHCWCIQMGPLHWQMLLPITSLWPIIFLEGAANALRWAHCISGCCCQWLCFGPLFCSEVLLIHSDGPIALADAANNCFAWAHQISGRHFGWAHCISRCCCQLLRFGPIYFWEALLTHSDGPIALADAAADCFVLAQYISGRHCWCTQMGPLHWWMLLLIASL